MYVRLAFAVAAHLEPEILIVDEVLAVGDAAFQKKCLGKMGDIAEKEGRTILFVSHNMLAVEKMCEKVVWIENGNIVGFDNSSLIVSSYLQRGLASVVERVWDNPLTAPGNVNVRLHRAKIIPLNTHQTMPITTSTPFQIAVEFWNYLSNAVLNLTIHLYTIEGICVFATVSSIQQRPEGLIKTSVIIPENFLNDNIYSVTVQIVKDTSATLYIHPDILIYEIIEEERNGNWFGKWPGVIRPKLEWKSENIALT